MEISASTLHGSCEKTGHWDRKDAVEEVREIKEKRSASAPDEPLRLPDENARRAKIVA